MTDLDTPNLFDSIPEEPDAPEEPVDDPTPETNAVSTDEAFWRWLFDNPGIYEEVVRRVERLAALGHTRLGMKMIAESIRFDIMSRKIDPLRKDGDGWSINNSFTAPLTRLLIQRRPDLGALFETRERRSA